MTDRSLTMEALCPQKNLKGLSVSNGQPVCLSVALQLLVGSSSKTDAVRGLQQLVEAFTAG